MFKLFKKKSKNKKVLPFKRSVKRPKIKNKYASTSRQRKYKVLLSKIKIPDFFKTVRFWIAIGSLIILIILGLGISFLLRSDMFEIKEIDIIADNVEDISGMQKIFNQYLDRNILTVTSNELYSEIKKNYPNVEDVLVRKSLDGKLKVEVIQNIAVYYVINFSGTYILDHNAKVLDVFEENKLLITDFEQKILRGEASPLNDSVKEYYLSKIPDEAERSKVKWDKVSDADKNRFFSEISQDLNNRITTHFQKSLDFIKNSEYVNLSGYIEYLQDSYKKGDFLNKDKLTFIALIADFFRNKNKVMKLTKWLSEYTLEVSLEENRSVLFSMKRELKEQFKDIETLIFHSQFDRFKLIDVRSVNFTVTR